MNEEQYELPEGWRWAELAQVAEIGAEQVVPKRQPDQLFNYVALENVEQGTGRLVDFTPTRGAEIGSNIFKFAPEHVLYGKLRPYLQKALVPEFEGVSATDLLPLRPNPEILDRRFLWRWLLSYDVLEYVVALQTGVKMPRLRTPDLEAMPIPIPPLPEQRRIVAKIERLFEQSRTAREALDGVPALMKRFRQSVLASAFRGELTERDPNDEPASVLLERIRAERREKFKGKKYVEPEPPDTSDLPELPDGWCWASPEQLASTDRYALAIGPFGSNLMVKDYKPDGVPLVFVRNIRSGVFVGPNTSYVSLEKAEELRAHRVVAGDILITKMGDPPGDACLYPETMPPAVATSDCVKWTLSPLLAEKRFFVHAIHSQLMRDQILEITKGVAQQKMSLARFKKIGVPLAPLAEQRRIVAKVEALFAQADAVEREVELARRRAQKVDQAILARAFRGEL